MPRAILHRFFPILLLLLLGCETVIDVTPPEHTPQLVAQGFFTPDSAWVVRVTQSVAYTSATAPGFVDNAAVQVFSGNEQIAWLTRADSGTYVGRGTALEPGQELKLLVYAPGFDLTRGSDMVPMPPPVTAFAETISVPPDTTASRRVVRDVAITLDDPAATAEHYGLLVVQVRVQEDRQTGQITPLPPSIFPFESDDPALGESLFALFDDETPRFLDAFFTDALFDGQRYTLDFALQYDRPRPDANVVIHRAFAVVLLSVSEHFYRYWQTASEQALSNENPFAEPLRVHSNMDGGPGIFAGFQYRIFPLTPDDSLLGIDPTQLCALLPPNALPQLPLCPTEGG